ncbi:MAG: hypothetical protein ACI4P6_04425 [Candidatus Spyradosoma sp.]
MKKIAFFIIALFFCLFYFRHVYCIYSNALESQRFVNLFRDIYEESLSRGGVPVEFLRSVERYDLFRDSFNDRVVVEFIDSRGFSVNYEINKKHFVKIECDIDSEIFVVKNTIPQA